MGLKLGKTIKGIDCQDAYHMVFSTMWDKETNNISAVVYSYFNKASRDANLLNQLEEKQYYLIPANLTQSDVQTVYEYLVTLPEFQGAVTQ